MINNNDIDKSLRRLKILRYISWIIILSLIIFLAIFIFKINKSYSAVTGETTMASNPCPSGESIGLSGNCSTPDQSAHNSDNPYAGSGGSSVSGLLSYGQKNVNLTASSSCVSNPNFLVITYTVGSGGDIHADIDLNGSSYSVPEDISGLCSNGFISCPSGTWYGNGNTCTNWTIAYSGGVFVPVQLGSSIEGTPSITTTSVALNGVQASSVTSNNTTGGLANCYCLNDSCPDTNGNAISNSASYLKENFETLGGIITSALMKGSSDQIGGDTITGPSSSNNDTPSITYSGEVCSADSNYNSPSSLEGLYNQGGTDLGNEVSGSQDGTANSNTESAMGLTSTPSSMLTTMQNNSFGGGGTVTCTETQGVSGGQCALPENMSFSGSWNLGNYEANGCASGCTCGSGSGGTDTTVFTSVDNGMNNAITGQPSNNSNPPSIGNGTSLAFTSNGKISGSISLDTFGCGWSFVPAIIGSGDTISGNAGGTITYNVNTNTFSGSTQVSTNTGTATLSGSGNCITDSEGGSICVNQAGADSCPSAEAAGQDGITFPKWLFTNETYYFPITSSDNGCSKYQDNSNCSVFNEQVCNADDSDCTTVIQNSQPVGSPGTYTPSDAPIVNANTKLPFTWQFIYTGSSVSANATGSTVNVLGIPQTYDVNGTSGQWPITNYTYSCTGKSPFTFPPVPSGNPTVNSNDTAFSYTGQSGTQYTNIPTGNTVTANASPEQCEVKQTVANTNVTSSKEATTANENTPSSDTQTQQKFINCVNTTGTVNNPVWTCPVPTGWTQEAGCESAQTANNSTFGSSVAELDAMDKAAQSLICSSN
jgi:hypothetical protein